MFRYLFRVRDDNSEGAGIGVLKRSLGSGARYAHDGGEESSEDDEENSESERLRLRTILVCSTGSCLAILVVICRVWNGLLWWLR